MQNRPLRRLTLAQLASSTGDLVALTALLFAIQAIGGTQVQFSAALAIEAVVFVVMIAMGGLAGDRLCRRSVMVSADLLCFVTQGILALLLISGRAQFWEILCTQAVLGAGAAFFKPSAQALIPEVVSGELVQSANAFRGIAMSVGGVAGPAIAALVLAIASPGWAFAVDALSFLLSAALLASIHVSRVERDAHEWLGAGLVRGWTEFRRRTWVWVVVGEFALVNALVFAPFFVLGPVITSESFGGPNAWAGILLALSVGELLGGLVALSWSPERPLLVATAVIGCWVVPAPLLASGAPFGFIMMGAMLAGGSMALFAALWQTTLQTHIPSELRARLSSYDLLGSFGLMPLGYLTGGLLLTTVGASVGLLAGAFILAGATAMTLAVPSVRHLRKAPRSFELRASKRIQVTDKYGPADAGQRRATQPV